MAAPLARTISLLAANRPNLQNGLSSASSVASYTLRLWDARSFFIVANQEVWGRPAGLFQSLWGTAVRMLLASTDSSILAKCLNRINSHPRSRLGVEDAAGFEASMSYTLSAYKSKNWLCHNPWHLDRSVNQI